MAEQVREARKQREWSTADLAARCGLSRAVIENIEGGRRDPGGHRRREVSVDELFAISEALGVGPLNLLPSKKFDSDDRNRVIQAVEVDMLKDRAELESLAIEMIAIERRQKAAADRVEKNQWLIEQLRMGNSSIRISLTSLPARD